MAQFKTIHTIYGLQRMAQAEATGTPINLTTMAVGDGNGNEVFPDAAQTQLVREIAASRAIPNRIYQDPENPTLFTAELVIPASVAGFTMREVGIFDADGGLFAVGNLPATYKPKASEGSYADTVVRLQFMVTNASIVTIMLDPNVAVATHAWVVNNMTPAQLFPGGTTHQVLRKKSNGEGDTEWADPSSVNVLVNTVEEEQTLAANQVNIDLTLTTTVGLAVYVAGKRLPNRAGVDGWLPHATIPTRAVLGQSYAAGTKIICAQNEPASQLVDPLAKSLNLSDLPNKAAARTNLGVYSKTESDAAGQPGDVKYSTRSTAPPGWLKANGGAISRTAYAALFAVIGTTYGTGDGFNTFNLPDLRGEFLRGLDDGRGIDSGRVLGSNQSHSMASHSHAAVAGMQGNHTHGGTTDTQGIHSHGGTTDTQGPHQHDSGWGESSGGPYGIARTGVQGSGGTDYDNSSFLTSAAGAHSHALETTAAGAHSHVLETSAAGAHSHSITVAATGGVETRPRNVALLPCIKY